MEVGDISVSELKRVAISDGRIEHIYHSDDDKLVIDGAKIEEREMIYSIEHGWREVGYVDKTQEIDKLKADLTYLSIMTGVEL